ncbi:hypothetical protein T4B_11972 [Trichinella pseudospiralis]|uniref:Uncharacterized protein n=1 Tax=Trichinella pseudospiralis TaxID=6337 RepID=A0A0V1GJL2_TRIPS|nr:hypothetical protein T4B_11972 [Trichinella pseudospiralis]
MHHFTNDRHKGIKNEVTEDTKSISDGTSKNKK